MSPADRKRSIPIVFWLAVLALLGALNSCAPAMEASEEPAREQAKTAVAQEVVKEPAMEAEEPGEGKPQPTPTLLQPAPTPTALTEARLVELEWPAALRLGDSDIVRLSLIPSEEGYTVQTDFPEHRTELQPIQVTRPGGYDLFAIARLDGVSFEIAPVGEQPQFLPPNEPVTWQWSLRPTAAGQQRIAVVLLLRWVPAQGGPGTTRENVVFSRGLDIQIRSFLGLTRSQAMAGGVLGLLMGGGLCLFGLILPSTTGRSHEPAAAPNLRLSIETPPGLALSDQEEFLLRTLFRRYARVALTREFISGYSGARTLLARPIHADGRADADTIVKIGMAGDVQREFTNYERYVKDTLPPITARIQHPPVTGRGGDLGALRYTFIGAPGDAPTSLRQQLLTDPDPKYLVRLLETFGPNWWMQRKPYTFRLAVEYDRVLPVHLILDHSAGRGLPVDSHTAPETLDVRLGDLVTLRDFPSIEPRPDGRSLSLHGVAQPGQPELRIRWLGLTNPNGATGRVVATRDSQLREFSMGMERFGLPDPIQHLPALLMESVHGSQSTIHGDLNLENILVGPGGFIWLIDFAQTRDGHTLFDFAHLGAELIAHVIGPKVENPFEYFNLLLENPFQPDAQPKNPLAKLLATLFTTSEKCFFNPNHPEELWMALCLSCLGALKYQNLDYQQKHLLYLTAAYLCTIRSH